MGRLDGQSILLTGGGSGIGRAIALEYLRQGASVTVLERSAKNAESLRGEWDERLEVLVGDATDAADLRSAVSACARRTGQLDNLTCCVGVFDFYVSVRTLGVEELASAAEEIWRVNVLSTLSAVNLCYAALRRAHGSVTLTLSESAFYPKGGGVLYGSSKWALRGIVSHLSVDLAPEVRVNGVAPGGTSGTAFGGLRSLRQEQTAASVVGRDDRIADGTLLQVVPQPSDHVGAYVYLADRETSRVVTGTVMGTDGGKA